MPAPTQDEMKLQILLGPHATTPAARGEVRVRLGGLGIEITGEGAVTLSGRMTAPAFDRVFGAGAAAEATLRIPDSLGDHVRSITLAPPITAFE